MYFKLCGHKSTVLRSQIEFTNIPKIQLVSKKDKDVNKYERLFNITLTPHIKVKKKGYGCK